MELSSIIPADIGHKAEIVDHSNSPPPPISTARPTMVSNEGVIRGLKRYIEMDDPKNTPRPRTKQRKLVSIEEDEKEDNQDGELPKRRETATPKYTDEEVERIIESLRGTEDIKIKVEGEFDDEYILSLPRFSKRPKVSPPSNQVELPVPALALVIPNASSPKVAAKATASNSSLPRRRRIFPPRRPANGMVARTMAKPNAEASGNA
jgi:hypothetical protein